MSTPILPLLVVVAGLPALFLSFRAFDQLVHLQRSSHPEAWLSDGRPYPFFFRGGLAWPRTFRAHLASRWLPMAWLFRKPDWVEHDPKAGLVFQRFRAFGLLWNLGVMPVFAVALIIAARTD